MFSSKFEMPSSPLVCGINCHKKCKTFMPNLCGINQKLLAEALQQVRVSTTPDKKKMHQLPVTGSVSIMHLSQAVKVILSVTDLSVKLYNTKV